MVQTHAATRKQTPKCKPILNVMACEMAAEGGDHNFLLVSELLLQMATSRVVRDDWSGTISCMGMIDK